MKITTVLLLLFTSQLLLGQTERELILERVDSLNKEIQIIRFSDKVKTDILLDSMYVLSTSINDTSSWIQVLLNRQNIFKTNKDSLNYKQICDSIDLIYNKKVKDELYYRYLLIDCVKLHQEDSFDLALKRYKFINSKIDTAWTGYLNLKIRAYWYMGSLERTRGNYTDAINYYNEGIGIGEKFTENPKNIDQKNELSGIYNSTGLLLTRIKEFERSIEMFKKSISVIDSTDRRRWAPYSSLSVSYIYLEKYEKADSICNILLANLDALSPRSKFNVTRDKVKVLIRLKKFKEAKKYLLRAKELHEKYKLKTASLINVEARLNYELKNFRKSKALYETYFEKTSKKFTNSKMMGARGIIKSTLAQNNIGVLEKFVYLDSIREENYKKNLESGIQEWEVKYETQQKENEIAQLKQDNEIKSLSLKVNKLWFALLGGVLLLTTALLYYFRKSLKQQKLANKYLDSQQQQLQNQNISLLEQISSWDQAKETFFTIPGKENRKIKFNDIIYISSDGNEVVFHTQQKKHRAWLRLKDLENQLPEEHFVRSHRSFIINIHHASFENAKYLLMTNGDIVGLSKSYKEKIDKALK